MYEQDREKGISGKRYSKHTVQVKGRVIRAFFFHFAVAVFSRESFYQIKSLMESHWKRQIGLELLKQELRD